MITLDRDAPLPIGEQLVEQLRYQIAAGRYKPGEVLPSTRVLAEQLGISFHTVRKAYQRLAEEGVLEVGRGGYVVAAQAALSHAARLERASGVVQEALRQLVALGLRDEEAEYVFQEQLQFFDRPGERRKLLFAAPYRELAESGAEQTTSALQERVEPVTLAELRRHAAADAVITPLPYLAAVRQAVPQAEVAGVVVGYAHDVLEKLARLMPPETLALVTRHPDAVAPIGDAVRLLTGFAGQTAGVHVEADRRQLEAAVRQADLVLATPQARRRVRALALQLGRAYAELAPLVAPESLSRVREALGR